MDIIEWSKWEAYTEFASVALVSRDNWLTRGAGPYIVYQQICKSGNER
jgi:hypothetical protein